MSKTRLLVHFSLIVALHAAHSAHADTVILHDGRTVTGKIIGETSRSVTVEGPNGRFTFLREKIRTVTKESVVQNQVRQFESLLKQGNINGAMAVLQDGKPSFELSPEKLNQTLLKHLEPAAAGAVATSPTVTILVDHLTASKPNPLEILLFAAALSVDAQNPESAVQLLRQAEQVVTKPLSWPAPLVSALINRIADGAISKKYGAVLAISASLSNRLPLVQTSGHADPLTIYGQIDELTRKRQFLQATSLFAPDLFLRRADLFMPQAERLLVMILAAPPTDASLAALESARVTLMPYVDKTVKLRCMKSLVNRLIEAKRISDAQHTIDQAATQDPDLGATLQHLMEFQKRRARLVPDDPINIYRLAAWGRSMGLLDESRALFSTLKNDPRFEETASLQLAIIENVQARERFLQLKRLYELNELEQLQRDGTAFLDTSPPDELAQQTRDLLQLAHFQNWSAEESSQGKAEAEFQQAERLANRREYDAALVHLNRIQLDRESSAAARKAQALRDRIIREKLKEQAASQTSLTAQ